VLFSQRSGAATKKKGPASPRTNVFFTCPEKKLRPRFSLKGAERQLLLPDSQLSAASSFSS